MMTRKKTPARDRTREAVLNFLRNDGDWIDLHALRREVWGTGDGQTPRLIYFVNRLLEEGEIESRGGLDAGRTFMVRAIAAPAVQPKETA